MPSEGIIDGADIAKGSLEYGEEKIKDFIKQFQDGNLRFIQDKETIDLVKEQRKSNEYALYKKYIKKPELAILAQIGLTLRKLDEQNRTIELQGLRNKIRHKYDHAGLRIAEFVQAHLLTELMTNLLKKEVSQSELSLQVEVFLNNLDRNSCFLQNTHTAEKKAEEIIARIQSQQPDIFIVFSRKSAVPIGKEVAHLLKRKIKEKELNFELECKEEKTSMVIFIKKLPFDIV